MKNAFVLHGRNCSPEMFWYPYAKKELENLGYKVWLPLLPENTSADRSIWVPYIINNFDFNKESVLIGVSSSCAAILEAIETVDKKVDKVILVAGFISPLRGEKSHPILKKDYNFEKIKNNIKELYIINSDIDPTGAALDKGLELFEKLGGNLIIMQGQGHFGSIKYNQPYKEFPLLKKLIS